MPPTITVDGEPFGPSAWRRFDWQPDWPSRYVTQEPQRFHLDCDRCGTTFPLWMADEAIWKRVPREWWRKLLCVTCFRKLVPEAPSGCGGDTYSSGVADHADARRQVRA